ncbi:hypothetical protein SS1G_03342 [Sclerotinia sclerotiorum 1980 UF-70]|uniref:DNA ligase IV n=1 Tax=Sclerotinia sclerotiorum (strain ATCC 18683 / 1980 / Ss-1) TaxID=665079 RepID=A7EDF2_SCLS1|nr:hypothetical protein SS1G_03342 [Sclerotinia sclerotiorum 1980 UF-70]EDO00868.1 hypothetical protein SS1G_03342 [Sclerotinia sclerotiorum 1980 UF-70]
MASSQQNKNKKPSPEAIADDERQYTYSTISKEELNDKYPDRPRNHGKTLPFHELFQSLFDPLEANKNKKPGPAAARKKLGPHGPNTLSPNEIRKNIIVRFMSRWRSEVGDDFYPALRLIIPEKDRDRAMCYEVLSKRPMRQKVGDMTIGEANEMLDKLALAQKEEHQLPIFREFYQKMNAEELVWLIRMILRQMKIGASEKTFLNLWHPDGEALFNVSSSLRRVCWELTDPNVTLEADETGVELMSCFQPQLAQFMSNSFEKMVEKMCAQNPRDKGNGSEFWIEEKLDGERIQMHMEEDDDIPGGRRFIWWSRKGKDYTYLYGNGFEDDNSALTRHMKNAFDPRVSSIILDGEMITWDPVTNKMVAFGTLKTAAISGGKDPFSATAARPVFKVFDCLSEQVDVSLSSCKQRTHTNHKIGANPMKCFSFFKVGGGFNADDYAAIRHQTDGKWIKWDAKSPPTEFIELAGSHQEKERPDVWIKPDDSIVMEVKAASVSISDSFRTNFTLRFPRFKRLRPDKDWKSALSIEGFMELKAKVEEGEDDEFQVDKKKRNSKRLKRDKVIAGTEDDGKVLYEGPTTGVFEGMDFCILSDMILPVKKSKAELETIIKNNGGRIYQSPSAKEDIIVIADKRVVKVASLIKSGKINIVKPQWVLHAVAQMEIDAKLGRSRFVIPYETGHMLFTREENKESIAANSDQYGDPYCRDVGPEELRGIMDGMDLNIDIRIAMNHFQFACGVFLHGEDGDTHVQKEDVTHIIFGDVSSERIRETKRELSGRTPHLVSWKWIRDSWDTETRLDENGYLVEL